ncbi:protein of unknown function [Nitratireductor aquimarinus]
MDPWVKPKDNDGEGVGFDLGGSGSPSLPSEQDGFVVVQAWILGSGPRMTMGTTDTTGAAQTQTQTRAQTRAQAQAQALIQSAMVLMIHRRRWLAS